MGRREKEREFQNKCCIRLWTVHDSLNIVMLGIVQDGFNPTALVVCCGINSRPIPPCMVDCKGKFNPSCRRWRVVQNFPSSPPPPRIKKLKGGGERERWKENSAHEWAFTWAVNNSLFYLSWNVGMEMSSLQFHKDNLRHLPQFPHFFVTLRILSTVASWMANVVSFGQRESRKCQVTGGDLFLCSIRMEQERKRCKLWCASRKGASIPTAFRV